MNEYQVTIYYSQDGYQTITVEAEDEDEAWDLAHEDADEYDIEWDYIESYDAEIELTERDINGEDETGDNHYNLYGSSRPERRAPSIEV